MHNILRTRFRVIDHAEFILIILGCKVETFGRCFFRQTDKKLFQQLSYFLSKRVENWHCICEIDEGDVEFVQAKDSYDDSSSEFTESDGVFDIYSADITEEEVFSESEDDLPAQTTVHQQQTIPQKKKSKQKTQVTFNGFLNHLYIIQNNLLLLENQVFVKITYRQIH